MPKYSVYAIVTGSKFLGEIEAESKEAAIQKGWDHPDCHISICHQCSREVEVGDIYEIQVDEIESAKEDE